MSAVLSNVIPYFLETAHGILTTKTRVGGKVECFALVGMMGNTNVELFCRALGWKVDDHMWHFECLDASCYARAVLQTMQELSFTECPTCSLPVGSDVCAHNA